MADAMTGIVTLPASEHGPPAGGSPRPGGGGDGNFPRVAREHYEIGGEIARGGGGRLLRARDLRLDRIVAIKEPLAFSTEIERRFFREAVLTARLQHPAIVPVHEIGRWDSGEPFYAMKLVSGRSLRDVVAATTSIEQRVALVPNVLAVADAMAYAHSEGIIHRDLKPSNVMVGAFGETQVIDWGLATQLHGDEHADREGVRGTPATMAPEQALGKPVDERTDVYGIGALLYEVLAGGAPYEGTTPADIIERVATHAPVPLVDRAPRAPRELIAIAAHAMARDPADRYPSARELADDLRRFSTGQLVRAHRYSPWLRLARLVRRNARVVVAGVASLTLGVGGALVIASALATPPSAAPICRGGERAFATAWDPARAQAVRTAIAAGGQRWATETADVVTSELDRYGREWAAMHREACEATSVRHEQSEAMLDLRMQCLDTRREEVSALATLLSRPDATLSAKAPKAVYALAPVQGCADTRALAAPVPAPVDLATRAGVEQVHGAIAEIKAMNSLGHYSDAAALATRTTEHAHALGYAPIEAEALEVQGDSLEYLDNYPGAVESYRHALWAAERGLDRARAASALINLVWVRGVDQGRHDDAHDFAGQAGAVLAGLGGDTALESNLASYEGVVFRDEGRLPDAERRDAEAIAKRRVAFGAMHPRYAMALTNAASVAADEGRYRDALALGEQAASINARTLGTHHPDYALSIQSEAASLNLLGRRVEARALGEQALAILTDALGPDHARVASAAWTLGLTETHLGDFAAAERDLRRALAVAQAARGANHIYVAEYECALGALMLRMRRFDEAAAAYRRAIAIMVKDPNDTVGSEAHAGVGLALLGLGQGAAAVAELESALAWQEHGEPDGGELARTRIGLARALWAVGRDRDRARVLAALAVQGYAADPASSDELHDASAWLANASSSHLASRAGGE